MSCLFRAGDTILWDPSNTVAWLFKGEAEAAASVFKTASGLGDIIEDECEIHLPALENFLAEVAKRYSHTTHPILKSLIAPLAVTISVLVERAGGQLPEAEPGQSAELAELRRQYSHSMPR